MTCLIHGIRSQMGNGSVSTTRGLASEGPVGRSNPSQAWHQASAPSLGPAALETDALLKSGAGFHAWASKNRSPLFFRTAPLLQIDSIQAEGRRLRFPASTGHFWDQSGAETEMVFACIMRIHTVCLHRCVYGLRPSLIAPTPDGTGCLRQC